MIADFDTFTNTFDLMLEIFFSVFCIFLNLFNCNFFELNDSLFWLINNWRFCSILSLKEFKLKILFAIIENKNKSRAFYQKCELHFCVIRYQLFQTWFYIIVKNKISFENVEIKSLTFILECASKFQITFKIECWSKF